MIYGNTLIDVLVDQEKIKHTYAGAVNPASINLRLGNSFAYPKKDQMIMLGDEVQYDLVFCEEGKYCKLDPGEFCLATTMEWISVPIVCAAFVQGRSSIGRAGLSVQNAGFVDPGFEGHITLELKNDAPYPIILVPGYPVTQLVYMRCEDASFRYDGKYKGQVDATGSRMHLDILKPGNQVEVNRDDGVQNGGD